MSRQRGVVFTERDEFVAELARDHSRGLVERGIVRVTKVGRPAIHGTITRVSVEAAVFSPPCRESPAATSANVGGSRHRRELRCCGSRERLGAAGQRRAE